MSADALSSGCPHWHGGQVRAYIESRLDATVKGSRLGAYRRVLESAFGKLHREGDSFQWRDANAVDESCSQLRLSRYISKAGPAEYCALLVAMGLDWSAVVEGFKAAIPWVPKQEKCGQLGRNVGIERARSALLDWVRRYPKMSPAAHRSCYWYLRLVDACWFDQHFPDHAESAIPSVEADRAHIDALVDKEALPLAIRSRKVRASAAAIRAYHRDRIWLQGALDKLSGLADRDVAARRHKVLQSRVLALQHALAEVLREEDRPARIFTQTLGIRAGLSLSQAENTIRSHPPLREAIDAANRDKERRQLAWAARQLMAEGKPLIKRRILARAGLPRIGRFNVLAEQLVVELKHELLGDVD
ncbi:hypothetical protein [Dyella tabacisoli]|uniref:hypothetical protein n=1 Tax=Dyella tabacisoli TaxID=2282381 RepID=UPI001CDBD96E|nr:hypothetical protein [Dyella tabacisoli]